MTSCALIWIYVGIGLFLVELVAPGFIFCFFGLAAVIVGVLRYFLGEGFGLAWQFAVFSALSVLFIALLRRWFKRALFGDREDGGALQNEYVGRIGRVTAAIRPPLSGRVMIGDAEWTASASSAIAEGADVRVVSRNNLTMEVEAV